MPPAVKPVSYQSLIDLFDGQRLGVPRTIRNNTQAIAHSEDDEPVWFKVVLHGTEIAHVRQDSVTLWAGKFRTATTMNRLNDVLSPLGLIVRKVAADFRTKPPVPVWHVYSSKPDVQSREFRDGMVIEYEPASL